MVLRSSGSSSHRCLLIGIICLLSGNVNQKMQAVILIATHSIFRQYFFAFFLGNFRLKFPKIKAFRLTLNLGSDILKTCMSTRFLTAPERFMSILPKCVLRLNSRLF